MREEPVPEPELEEPTDPLDPDAAFTAFVTAYELALANGQPLPEPPEALQARWLRVRSLYHLFDRARFSPASPVSDSTLSLRDGAVPPARGGNGFIGRRIAHYRLERELGRGGMGVVYRALDLVLDRTVALKLLHPAVAERPGRKARFDVEGQLLARLQHTHIVQVYGAGEHDGLAYLAMEFVNGPTLHQNLDRQPLAPRAAAALVEPLARAVAHAHELGVIHRDLKPANVLLTPDGTPKISDFGLATALENRPGLTMTGEVVGTPNYLAPEMVTATGVPTHPAVDVYGLGTILYEALTDRPPFVGESVAFVLLQVQSADPVSPRALLPSIPRDLETICLKCLEKEPARRYPSAHALADDLRRYLDGKPIQARPVGSAERVWRWARRKPAVAGLLAGVVALLVGGLTLSTWFGLDARWQALEARRQEGLARTATAVARAAEAQALAEKRSADLRAAELTFRIALEQAEAGAVDRGLLLMLRAWRQTPADAAPFRNVIRANLAGWSRQFPRLRQAVPVGPPPGGQRLIALGDPEAKTFLTGARDRPGIRGFESATGQPVTLPPTLDECKLLGVSTSGRWLSLGRAQATSIFDRATGADMPNLVAANAGPSLPILHDLPDLLVNFDGKTIGIRDLRTGQELPARFSQSQGDFTRPTRDGDGRAVILNFPGIALGRPTNDLRVEAIDMETGRPLAPFSLAGSPDPCVRYDGREAISGYAGDGHWFNLETGRPRDASWRPRRRALHQINSRDGLEVLRGEFDHYLRAVDLATGLQRGSDLLREPQLGSWGTGTSIWDNAAHSGAIRPEAVTTSPDGRLVFTYSLTGVARVWDTALCRLQATSTTLSAPTSDDRSEEVHEVEEATYAPDRRRVLLTRRERDEAQLLDARTGAPLAPPIRQERVELAAFSPDGRYLATAPWQAAPQFPAGSPRVVLRDGHTGQPIGRPWSPPIPIHALAFSPDGALLAAGGDGGTIILDMPTMSPRHHLKDPISIRGLKWSRDSRRLIALARPDSAGKGSGVRVWDARDGRPLGPFRSAWFGHRGPEAAWIAPDPPATDEQELAFCEAGGPGLVRLSPDASEVRGSSEPTGPLRLVHFSADGQRMAAGVSTNDVRQWNTRTGRPIGPVLRHPEPTQSIRYSPDARLLAVTCLDNSIRLWDADTGWPLGPPLMHLAPPVGLVFADDGRTLLSLSRAGVARAWPIPQPIQDDPDRFETWLQARCGLRLDGEEPVQATVEEWENARHTLDQRWPHADPALAEASDDLSSWHRQRLLDAEEVGNDRGQLDHLASLATLHPREWTIHLRIARVHLRVATTLPAGPARTRELRSAWTSLRHGLFRLTHDDKPSIRK